MKLLPAIRARFFRLGGDAPPLRDRLPDRGCGTKLNSLHGAIGADDKRDQPSLANEGTLLLGGWAEVRVFEHVDQGRLGRQGRFEFVHLGAVRLQRLLERAEFAAFRSQLLLVVIAVLFEPGDLAAPGLVPRWIGGGREPQLLQPLPVLSQLLKQGAQLRSPELEMDKLLLSRDDALAQEQVTIDIGVVGRFCACGGAGLGSAGEGKIKIEIAPQVRLKAQLFPLGENAESIDQQTLRTLDACRESGSAFASSPNDRYNPARLFKLVAVLGWFSPRTF